LVWEEELKTYKMPRLKVTGVVHKVYKKPVKKGKKKSNEIFVTHPNVKLGKYDTINLTKTAGAKTVKEGVKATKKWHKANPHTKTKKNGKR